jgi:hypothetical protein
MLLLHTTDALVVATHVPEPELFSAAVPMRDVDRSGDDRTVQIATVGKPNRRALNTGLLTAIGRATIEQDRVESLLSVMASKHAGIILSEAGTDVCPLSAHRPNVTEEISA